MPTNDGLMFYKEYKRPALVVHTGFCPKVMRTCNQCSKPDTIAVELFTPDSNLGYRLAGHHHVSPDTELNKWIQSLDGFSKFSPVSLKHGRELELWIWSFFFLHSKLRRNNRFRLWAKVQNSEEPMTTYDRIWKCLIDYPNEFRTYYNAYTLIVGKKYLCFE